MLRVARFGVGWKTFNVQSRKSHIFDLAADYDCLPALHVTLITIRRCEFLPDELYSPLLAPR